LSSTVYVEKIDLICTQIGPLKPFHGLSHSVSVGKKDELLVLCNIILLADSPTYQGVSFSHPNTFALMSFFLSGVMYVPANFLSFSNVTFSLPYSIWATDSVVK